MIDLRLNNREKENLTEEEIEIAMARKLEILILPLVRRNMKFFYAGGDLKGKANAYRDVMKKEDVEEGVITGENRSIPAVCKPFCNMVASILRENGINAETVSCDTDIFKHADVLITTKSGKKYIINYLEDIEYIQTGMRTPDFASKEYYERRYKKFEGGTTVDGKDLKGISFLEEERLSQIDTNLGYKKDNLYMNDVIAQIKSEFSDFRNVMAENEWLEQQWNVTEEEKEQLKERIYDKYDKMSKEEELEAKMDWIFNYFNERMDIKGHADFVMYYSRLLLKEVLSKEEYSKVRRYDCFVYNKDIPKGSRIVDVLDYENPDNSNKNRFSMIRIGEKSYVFSTKPKSYVKLNGGEVQELNKYANITESEKPSDLVLYLCDRGNALPLVFHPLGNKLLNERAELIDKKLSEKEREEAIRNLANSIETTDEPVTSILIPYPNNKEKYLYINENDEFVIKEQDKEIVYHYDEKTDDFKTENISPEER